MSVHPPGDLADDRGPDAPLLTVRDLETHFDTPRGRIRAVDGVSLDLDHGRSLGIVGESGSGKSVLSRSIMGLLSPGPGVHRSGRVRFAGRDLHDLDVRALRDVWGDDIAMVFQDPMTSLNPVVRIGRQITESLRHHRHLSGSAARARALQLLEAVGIPEPRQRLRQYPHELSGGMRQRVTIAIALSCDPRLLLADEPTTALDVTVQAQILDLLDEQRRERDMAMVLVTHDLGVAAARTDEIAVMYGGRIVERAPTRTLFRGMRHPYTQALLTSIPRLDTPPHTLLPTIPGRPPDLAAPPSGCRFNPRCRHAQPRCLVEQPPLVGTGEVGHEHACFFPVGTPEGEAALAANEQAGHTAAGTPLHTAIAGAK